ncbi:DNA alkylation repair enzyme [Capsaspora owczarzaki ATCC 30864]|nr:DNA alkylation repair enzyme [Capsaspora owczarzaki ATCC 30864]|eukprot:XP_004363448.1 DNA alkylation repair enzyme [Capsaspora owczarzaki ATCC 30864]
MKLVSAAARLAKGGAASAAAAASSGKHTWPAFTTSFTHSSPSPLTTKLSYVDTASAINTPHYTHAAVLPTIPPQEQRFAQSVVDIVRAHYTRGANAAEAAHMRKYMRSLFHYFGLKSPQRTALSSAILTELAEKAIHPASFDASAATIRLLFAQPERECHYFAMNFLQHFVVQPHVKLLRSKKTSASANKDTKDPTPAVATTGLDILNFTKEIAQLHAWWDTIDGLSTTVVGEVVMANRDELEPVMRAWIADDCLWVRRMALLHQLQYKEKTNEDLLFTFVLARHDETDFFIQKAMGWALRQHARVRPSVVRAFVRNFRHVLPRLTQKEAMKHL